jgi:hypothetical protein
MILESNRLQNQEKAMRPQTTVYIDKKTRKWLTGYAAKLGLRSSEVVRFLIRRETEIEWLAWAIQQPDPKQPKSGARLRRSTLAASPSQQPKPRRRSGTER